MVSGTQTAEARPAPVVTPTLDDTLWETLSRNRRLAELRFLDPQLFPDRDRLAQTAADAILTCGEHVSGRMRNALERVMQVFWEYNNHPETKFEDYLTLRELPAFLDDREFQERVLSRVADRALLGWVCGFNGWSYEARWSVIAPLRARLDANTAAQNRRPALDG